MTRPTRLPPRGSTRAALVFGALALALALCLAQAIAARGAGETRRAAGRELVAALGLTDLALFTDARYTRNPALADLHSAFQDGPASLEHFPSGSLVSPPRDFGRGRLEAREE